MDDARRVFAEGAATSTITTNVVLTLDDMVKVTHGENDVTLQLTNGATITGADLIRRTLAGAGLFTLIHPEEGPVNLYRARHASAKQRRMLEAEGARCAWPSCRRPAAECQAHHIFEYARGGHTHPANMCLLCPYHNSINGLPGRGRMARINGRIAWLPPHPRHANQPAAPPNSASPPHSASPPEPNAPPPVFTGRAPRGPTTAVP